MKFRITCDKASTICDKSQYKEASFLERIRLAYHVSICESCNLYVKQNRKCPTFLNSNQQIVKRKPIL